MRTRALMLAALLITGTTIAQRPPGRRVPPAPPAENPNVEITWYFPRLDWSRLAGHDVEMSMYRDGQLVGTAAARCCPAAGALAFDTVTPRGGIRRVQMAVRDLAFQMPSSQAAVHDYGVWTNALPRFEVIEAQP